MFLKSIPSSLQSGMGLRGPAKHIDGISSSTGTRLALATFFVMTTSESARWECCLSNKKINLQFFLHMLVSTACPIWRVTATNSKRFLALDFPIKPLFFGIGPFLGIQTKWHRSTGNWDTLDDPGGSPKQLGETPSWWYEWVLQGRNGTFL